MSGVEASGTTPRSDVMSRSRVYGFALLIMVPLAVGLGVWDRVIVSEDATASGRLTAARIHIEQVTSLRRDTRKTHVALLESWLAPEGERAARKPALEKLLATVRREHDGFQALPTTEDAEGPIRDRLAVAHREWSDLMGATLEGNRGPERLAQHQAALGRVDVEADAVLVLNSGSGEAVDQRIAALRARQKFVEQGFLAALLGSIGLGLLWRARSRADERIREAKRREEARIAELRSQFFANMSHELRTPLVSITNLTTNFDDDTSTPETRKKFAKHIESEAKELLGNINNILDLAKIESAHAELLMEDIELGAVLERCVGRCRPLIGDKPVELILELLDGDQKVHADFVKLQQVFTNLIANAIKFTEEGTVTVRTRAPKAGKVEIEVADTGIGIDAAALETIWSAFRQGDARTSRKYGGTGLGLAIVKGVLDRVGGSVSARSTLGEGTVFTVSLVTATTAAASE